MKSLMPGMLFACLFFACEQDPGTNLLPSTNLPSLHFSGDQNLIPLSQLHENRSVIFSNTFGEQKVLTIALQQSTRIQYWNGLPYNAEYISVQYKDLKDETYIPDITARMDYSDESNYDETIWITLSSKQNNGITPTITLCAEDHCSYVKRSLENCNLGSNFYPHVFASCKFPATYNSFSEIYYTVDKGIVAFQGKDGELWSFERFDE